MMKNMNILDTPVPEIKTPILKPVKVSKRNIKKLSELALGKIDKFADWIMNVIPKEKLIQVNERVENLKKTIKRIYEKNTIKQQATAFRGFMNSYRIKGSTTMDPENYFNSKKTQIINFLREKEKPIKIRMSFDVEFYKANQTIIGSFNSKNELITQATDLNMLFERIIAFILELFASFQNRGSGWIFKKILYLDIHINKHNPISGSSYIKLPRKLTLKKAIINPKNKDNQCFKWAITIAKYTPKINIERISKELKKNAKKLNWSGLEFPVELDKIDIFEKNNSYAINVFGYKQDEEEVYPLRISAMEANEKINLLMISDGVVNHYCWIKNMSRLVNKQTRVNYKNKKFFCHRCLNSFNTKDTLDKHDEYCKDHEAVSLKLPKKGAMLEFKNFQHSMRVPFVISADFECFTEKIQSCENNTSEHAWTEKFQHHKPSGFCYLVKCVNDQPWKPKIVKYTATSADEDIGEKFVQSIEETVKTIYNNIFHMKVNMTTLDEENYKNATECHICEKPLAGDKVLDHDHITGNYRGAAHNACNLNYKIPKHIPVIFHNLAGYDAHLFVKNLGVSQGKIDCIPNNEEKYISFKKEIIVDQFINKEGKQCNVKREIRFLDSFKFMASSLDKLSANLKKEDLKNMKSFHTDGEKLDLLVRKGVFPYDYFDSLEKLNETELPSKNDFYSKLNNKHISDKDYTHAKKVWQVFQIKTLKDYHDLYLKTDVLLLADVFETFRDVCMKNYSLDPCWYYTAPGLSWDAMLKKTKIKLELLHDSNMLLMIEKGIRGGISIISKRYAKANNKYLNNYNPNEESSYIKYLDANNLYGWAMSQPMPHEGFKWMHKAELKNWRKFACILEVDLEYPKELHELHNDYPLAPESLKIGNVEKLVPNLKNKEKYVVHHSTLKLYESLGLKITKIHRGILFKESKWLAEYINLNTNLRTLAENDFEKDFFKLMNNSVFGKTMENIRNRQDIRLCNSAVQVKKLISKPNFKKRTIFSENLVAVHMGKTESVFNKPIYIGMSILDVSKNLMFDFHSNYMKRKYNDNASLLLSDTDSLMYEIKTDDFYKDIYTDIKQMFDTSAYVNHPVIDKKLNKKVIGMMKDETSGEEITEFVGLRPKLYAFMTHDDEIKKAKGVKKSVIKAEITFDDYKDCLFSGNEKYRKMNTIRSYHHEIYAETINKVALSAADDKRIIMADGIHTKAIGN